MTVLGGVLLRPAEIAEIVLPRGPVEWQRPEVARCGVIATCAELPRDGDVMRGDQAARAATAAVNEDPDARCAVVGVGFAAEFDEMVATAERAQLRRPLLANDRGDSACITPIVREALPFLGRDVLPIACRDVGFDQRVQFP